MVVVLGCVFIAPVSSLSSSSLHVGLKYLTELGGAGARL